MNPWSRFVAWCAITELATPLALFRVAIGAVAVGELLWVLRSGVLPAVWLDSAYGGYRPMKQLPWLVDALGGASPEVVWPLFWVTLLAAVALTLGLGGRVVALLVAQGMMALYDLNQDAGGGHDKLHLNALWLLVLAPSTTTLSLDCRLRSGAWTCLTPMPAWVRSVAVVQLVTVYFTTGVQKVSPEWMPWGGYSAVYYATQAPSWQRFNMDWVASVYPLTQIGTAVSWIWECSAWVLLIPLFRPRSRWDLRLPYAAIGVLFHGTLWLIMNLGPFSWVTLSYYACLWRHEEWAALWERIRRWRRP